MGKLLVVASYLGWLLLAVIVVVALLALSGVDRFEPSLANPPI